MERATGTEVYGCGSPQSTDITLNIQTTTGSNFSISLNGKNTVEYLKKLVSKKLRVGKDRICLLHRERQLRDGTLEENGLLDGSRVILLPSVETGLLSQRQENSVMQALESLNETQVNDFLTGKSPLNLTMRLGDHMMLIQLQLSTLHSNPLPSSSRSLKTSTPTKGSSSSVRTPKRETKNSTSLQSTPEKISHKESDCPADNCTDKTKDQEKSKTVFKKTELEILKKAINWYQQIADKKNNEKAESTDKDESMDTSNCTISDMSDSSLETDQSPIKSLSNLVSSPLDPTVSECKEALVNTVKSTLIEMLSKNKILQGYPSTSKSTTEKPCQQPLPSLTPESSFSDDSDNFTDQSSFLAESTIDEYPMEHLFNSAVDKGLFEEQEESMMDREISHLATTSHGTQEAGAGTLPSFQSISEPLKNKRFQYLLHKTSKFKHPIGQNKQKAFMQSVVNKHKKRMQIRQDNTAQPSTSRTEPYITNSRKLILQPSKGGDEPMASTSTQVFKSPESPKKADCKIIGPPDTKDLIEASKNLTQKLKKLSREVLTNKVDLRSTEETVRSKIGPGAMIESMKHHGKGVYSGTFSGTLNPALQDRFGRPKKDISTIIHILNDLLCASPPISLSQKDSKHSCTTTSSEELTKCLGCSQPACSYGKCDGHLPSTSSSTLNEIPCTCGVDLPACHCLPVVACEACADQTTPENPCNKCNTAKSLALDNSKTKCKLEQLRLVMQQKKQRREARKLKTMPYSTPSKTLGAPEVPASISEEIESIA